MIALPPLVVGAVQLTRAPELLPCAVTPVGAPGTEVEVGTTAFDCAEAVPVPAALVAATVKV